MLGLGGLSALLGAERDLRGRRLSLRPALPPDVASHLLRVGPGGGGEFPAPLLRLQQRLLRGGGVLRAGWTLPLPVHLRADRQSVLAWYVFPVCK